MSKYGSCLKGEKTFKPRPQNMIFVLFRGSFQNFRSTPPFLYGSPTLRREHVKVQKMIEIYRKVAAKEEEKEKDGDPGCNIYLNISLLTFLASANQFCMAFQRFGQYFLAPSTELQRTDAFASDSFAGMGLSAKYISDSFSRLMKSSLAVSLLV